MTHSGAQFKVVYMCTVTVKLYTALYISLQVFRGSCYRFSVIELTLYPQSKVSKSIRSFFSWDYSIPGMTSCQGFPSLRFSAPCLSSSLSRPRLSWLESIGSLSTGRHCTLGQQCPAARGCILGNLGSFRFLSVTLLHYVHNIALYHYTLQIWWHVREIDGCFILTCLPTVHCCSMVHTAARAGSQCPPVREIWHMSSGQSEENISDRENIGVL